VQPRGPRVVGNLHVGADRGQPVERPSLGRPGVHGCDDPNLTARPAMGFERRSEYSQAVPANERAQQVDAISGVNLPLDGGPNGRLAASVHQEVGGGQRNEWLWGGSGERSASGERPNLTQNSQGNDQRVIRLDRGRALLVPQPLQKCRRSSTVRSCSYSPGISSDTGTSGALGATAEIQAAQMAVMLK
jgi:hypothetical protein